MRALPLLLEAVELGKSLRRIDPKLLKLPESGRTPSWWKGEEPYLDVFLESDAQGVAWFQATVRGRCVNWDRANGPAALHTGQTNELDVDVQHPASKLVQFDASPSLDVLSCVLTILEHAAQKNGDALLAEATEIVRHAAMNVDEHR